MYKIFCRFWVCLLVLTILAGCASQAVPTLDLPVEELNERLFEAIRENDVEEVELLVASGADLTAIDSLTRVDPLTVACFHGSVEMVSCLIEAGADPNSATGPDQITPLIATTMFGNAEVIPVLVDAGADLEYLSGKIWGQNALHVAAFGGETATVEALLDAGANIDAVENTNSVALHYAAYHSHTDTVALLIERGADLNVRDNGGKTPLGWARGADVIALLEEAGAEK